MNIHRKYSNIVTVGSPSAATGCAVSARGRTAGGGHVMLTRFGVTKPGMVALWHAVEAAHRLPPHPVLLAPVGVAMAQQAARVDVVLETRLPRGQCTTLHDWLGLDGQRSVHDSSTVLHVMRDAACGLAHLASHGYVHGCLSAHSVIVVHASGGGRLLCPWPHEAQGVHSDGTADSWERNGWPRLLPHQATYAAPEVAQGALPTPAADVYSFGAVMYAAMYGRPPVDARERACPPPLDVPVVRSALQRCLAADPAKRCSMSQLWLMLYEPTQAAGVAGAGAGGGAGAGAGGLGMASPTAAVRSTASQVSYSPPFSHDTTLGRSEAGARLQALRSRLAMVRDRLRASGAGGGGDEEGGEGGEGGYPAIIVDVARAKLVKGVLAQFSKHAMGTAMLRGRVSARFIGENGVDEGGLRQEMIESFVDQLCATSVGLFESGTEADGGSSGSGESFLPVHSCNAATTSRLKIVGRVLAKCLFEGWGIPRRFSPYLWKYLCAPGSDPEVPATLQDLSFFNPELARGLQQLLDEPDSVEDAMLTFEGLPRVGGGGGAGASASVADDADDADEAVTSANVAEFVNAKSHDVVYRQRRSGLSAVRDGFRAALQSLLGASAWSMLALLLGGLELQALLCGQAVLDATQILAVTRFSGAPGRRQKYRRWLQEVLQGWDSKRLAAFLCFVSSTSCIPVGCSSTHLTVDIRGANDKKLPSAATCSRTLYLPAYSSVTVLAEKLALAIDEGAAHFGMA